MLPFLDTIKIFFMFNFGSFLISAVKVSRKCYFFPVYLKDDKDVERRRNKMQGQETILHSTQPTIFVPTNVDVPQIPPEYWGTETGTILAIAVLIRAIAILIQSLATFKAHKPQSQESSSNPPNSL